tara:strand:- start:20160 stop:22289 length:2130 start_codon:yes stop_codon:yes gene_type:complete
MACNVKNELVTAQRDIFKAIKESAKFKKAEGKLNEIITNGVDVNELMAQQKTDGKKNLISRTTRGTKTDTVPLPLDVINVEAVKVKKEGTNFFYRLTSDKYDVTVEDEVDVVITDKSYKEIKVTYQIEDTAEKRDLQTDTVKLQKLADAIKSGDDKGAIKLFEDEVKKVTGAFDGVFSGIHQIVDKIRTDANIPLPASEAVVIVDKEKRHTGSNVINLEDPVSITRVKARKANTNFFFNVSQYKFIKEGGSVIATNSYEEYIVEYRGKGSSTSGNNTGKLPSTNAIVSDLTEGLGKVNQAIGDVTAQINNAAGKFSKDISGLISAGSSGSLIQDALSQAQNQPATYTVEKTVRGKNTNAIVLESLAGGESGVLEVFTRREDQSFFSQMQKGNVAGWRLEGEELYIFEPRAEIKCKYTQEVDPPASSGVPALSNDKDIPKLDPCKDIPAISVKIQEEIRKDQSTGQTEVVTIKNKESKPPTRKTPTIKPEAAPNVAESPTIVDAQTAPTANNITGLDISRNDANLAGIDVYLKTSKMTSEYWNYKSKNFVDKLKKAVKDPLFVSFKKRKKDKGIHSSQKFLNEYRGLPDGPTEEEAIAAEYAIQTFVGLKSFSSHLVYYKAAVAASSFEQAGKMTTEKYEGIRDDFFNYEGVVPADDKSNQSGADIRFKVTTEEDKRFFQSVRNIHKENRKVLRTVAVYKGELDISQLNA